MDSQAGNFRSTHWSAVLRAGLGDAAALEELCQDYWTPVNAHLRRTGHQAAAAHDLTQKFFCSKILREGWLKKANQEKGKFRSYLLKSLERFVIDQTRREQTQVKGGGQVPAQLDEAMAVLNDADEDPSSGCDEEWDRQWARTVSENALARLRDEYRTAEHAPEFDALVPVVLDPGLTDSERRAAYVRIALQFGVKLETVKKTWVNRFRMRLRELLRSEIAKTLGKGEDLETEFRYLLKALRLP